jgi:hypothetical protein
MRLTARARRSLILVACSISWARSRSMPSLKFGTWRTWAPRSIRAVKERTRDCRDHRTRRFEKFAIKKHGSIVFQGQRGVPKVARHLNLVSCAIALHDETYLNALVPLSLAICTFNHVGFISANMRRVVC